MRRFIILSIVLMLGMVGCHRKDRTFSVIPSSGSLQTDTVSDILQEAEDQDWQVYRNMQYGLSFQYPPIYVLRVQEKTSDPGQLIRISLLSPDVIGTPLEDRIPPAFAIDIYDNSLKSSVEEWLESKGYTADKSRYSITAVIIGGLPGLHVSVLSLLEPSSFYYIARERYLYRFIPMGQRSDKILESIRFGP